MIANYEFGPGPQDIALLQKCASVAAMAHAPFIAAAGPGSSSASRTTSTCPTSRTSRASSRVRSTRSGRRSASPRTRATSASCLPALPPPPAVRREHRAGQGVQLRGDVVGKHDAYCWGNAAFAFATRIADSFAKFRWCPNIIGPQAGGTVENLPLHQYEAMGEIQTKIPTEIMLTERREFELSEEGFIGLTYRKDSDNACFFSANSVQKPKYFGRARRAARGAQLPPRHAAPVHVHHQPHLALPQGAAARADRYVEGARGSRARAQRLDRPVRRRQDVVSAGVRGRRPLRKAQIIVTEVEGNAGWYKVDMQVRPHFKYMGAFFTLSLVGKLDKE
jgi:type VI secretion system protein ImpC